MLLTSCWVLLSFLDSLFIAGPPSGKSSRASLPFGLSLTDRSVFFGLSPEALDVTDMKATNTHAAAM